MKRFLFGCLVVLAAGMALAAELLTTFVGVESGESVPVRLENRAANTTVRAVVCGTELKSASPTTSAVSWDTTRETDGWHTYTSSTNTARVLVRNAAAIAVEGGRLQGNTTWSAAQTHIVRNRVIVPNGVRLTIEPGTVVKFGEGCGIDVESGGALSVAGNDGARSVLTSIADDSFGGDTDLLSTNAVYGSWNITSSGSYDVYYTHVRYGTIASLPTVSMPASVTAQRIEGKARIPLTLSGTRSNRMSLHWKAVDGTAKYGVDYTLNEGEAVWANSASTTQYFEIPLVKNDADEGIKTFRIQMVSVEDCNPNPQRIETTVTIVSGTSLPVAVSAESDVSAPVRLENRLATMVAHALVHGTEWKSADSDSVATAWDTTKESDGWHTLTAGTNTASVLVRNDKSIAIEGGRVTSNETWSATQTHIVRNWVIVPSGVTLTVDAGAIVKFAELTGIRVEDGGLLRLSGSSEARITLTSLADDGVGGDTDLVSTNAVYGSWSVSGSVSDAYAYVRYGTISALPTVSMPASVTAQRSEGKVRVPVTLSGTRSNRMAIHWRAIDGTAKAGVDFLKASGEETFANTSSTTVYFEIPLSTESAEDGVKTFEIELVSAEDINVDVNRLVTKVTIVTGSVIPVAKCAESEVSESVRLENRTVGTTGRALAHGTEWKASAPEACATSWNTMNETDGWHTLTADTNSFEVLVRNDASIAVEGGRLSSNETWTAAQTHLVRNWVIVPSGVTLTVVTNAVVKFCESTGIKVESGGSLMAVGATNAPAVFTSVADDVVGGDTDLKTVAPTNDLYSISVSGTFADAGAVFHYTAVSGHPTVSLPGSCEMNESHEQVQIPISVSGSRSTPYRVYWRASDDSATYPGDYTVKQGVVEWSGSSSATQYIIIPVLDDGVEEETERFKVELYDAQGANISRSSAVCTVTVRDSTAAAVPLAICTESAYSEPVRLENRAEGTFGKAVVRGVEWRSASGESRADTWDTTTESDGWKRFEDGTNTADVVVRNDSSIAVEGGRLSSNETWTATQTHLVRHRVIVPSGVTLTVVTNSVVKFCENTGITVESGGRLQLLGDLTNNVYLTTAADDTVGGNTDLREASSDVISYTLSVSGTLVDENAVIRGTSVSGFGTASVDGQLVVDAGEGVIRIPVYVSGSRSTQFSVDWKTSDGQTGQLVWTKGTGEGMKWVTLNVEDCSESFTFELSESRGINISTSSRVSRVKVYGNTVPTAVCVASDESAPVRLENRGEGTFAKALVNGETWKSATGETRAEEWDTTAESDGWKHLEDGEATADVVVRNDPSIAIAGGRLLANATWSNNVTHVVRNWVVIPSGVTLTIAEGSVVKFAERTGFRVEAGGNLIVSGTEEWPVVYTSVADDTIGGETDMREKAPVYGDYSIEMAGGTYTDTHCAIRYATFSNLGTASLPADVVANERDGVARIPLFVNTSRTQPFCVDWRVRSGTYASSGRVNWNTYSEGTKYIQIPLTAGTVTDGFDDFTIELYESQGINLSTSSYTCKVRIYADENVPMATCANSDESAPVRLENRDPETSYGAIVVYGTEWKSVSDYDRAEEWDTTQEEEGWYDVHSDEASPSDPAELQLLVRNDESVVVEGGRLNETTTWDKDKVHLVRNWVIVPSGVTLTIAAGTVVKFCDQTGIKVEAGGRLNCVGTSAADVTLTSIHDDTIGGETDLANVTPVSGYYSINCSGTFTDTYTAMRYGTSSTFGSASTTAQVIGKKDSGHVRIPVTISGSRSTPFAVDWVAIDGTAKFGKDYLCASGRVDWASSSQGTKYIDIPLDRLASSTDAQHFTVKFTVGRGINLGSTTTCEVFLYDTLKDPIAGSNHGYAESEWSTLIPVDSTAGTGPVFVQDERDISYSTYWATNGVSAAVSIADAKKQSDVLYARENSGEGQFRWSPVEYEDGRYDLTHEIADRNGQALRTDRATFIVNRDVVLHVGRLMTNEVWKADKVHLVMATVTVPSAITLAIEPHAVVKFMSGTSIVVETGGLGICNGAIITHAYDDSAGGDTFFDGNRNLPVDGAYRLTGTWEDDANTQYRFAAPLEVGGTIKTSTCWVGRKTYRVTSNITLSSGVTLDIEPGAILKFASGCSLTVSSGAALHAMGTRALPIVFTSYKDDEHGGDTNGDGATSTAQPGDWRNLIVAGEANLQSVELLYGGGASTSSDTGMISIRPSGSLVVDNSRIMYGLYDGIFSYGTVIGTNTVIYDCDRGVNTSGGIGIFWNCVIDLCRWGVMSEGGSGTYYNCIITRFYGSSSWPTGWGVAFWSGSLKTCNCDVWSTLSGSSNYRSSPSVANNISADPQFLDPDNGDFRISETSPCVDAADGTVAPSVDWYGQPRQTYPLVIQKGQPDAKGEYADIGIHEVQPRNVKSDVDLAVVRVSAPDVLTVGEEATVSWTVRNEGSEDAEGAWSDRAEIVCANGAVVVLGTKTVTGLVAGGERTFTATWRVPAAQVGPAYVRVTANCNRDVFEGSLTANNSATSEGMSDVALSDLAELQDDDAWVEVGAKSETSFRIPSALSVAGGLLVVSATSDVSVWTGDGQVPTADIYFADAVKVADDIWIVRVPEGGDAYVTVRNDGAQAAVAALGFEPGGFILFDTGRVTAPNAGTVTLNLFGNGFDEGMQAFLEGNGQSVAAVDVAVIDAVHAAVTFEVEGLPEGDYQVRLSKDGESVSCDVLTLTRQTVGAKWTSRLDMADLIRSGRVYTGTYVYGNEGDVAFDAPYVVLKAESGTLIRFSEADAWTDTLEFMATSESAPASKIKPGETRRIPFFYKTSGSSVRVTSTYTYDDPKAFPWDTNGGYMRPSWATDEIWNRALTTLKRNVGATWNDYLVRMRANCDHLQKIGTPTYRIDRIWQLEVNEALGVDHAIGALAGGTDLARSGRGYGLSFTRSYGSGMHQRLRKGVLGYGWSDNLSTSCELQENGTRFVIQSGNGASYAFTKVSGSWAPEDARDKTVMTETSAEWVLTARSGMVVRFSKSKKRLVSVRDNMSNGIDFTHDASGNVTEAKHTDGQWLRFTYSGGLLVSANDDQGRTVRYVYEGEMLSEVTAFNGRTVKYRYLAADDSATSRALRQIVAADGQTKDFTYDEAGRVATASRNGTYFTSEIVRGELGSYAVVAPNGGVTEVTVGAGGETLATVNALGQKVQRTYTADTLLESVVSPSGKRSKIFYDSNGQAVKSMDAAGAATSFAYTEDFGSLKSVTDARQNAITYGYDKLGRSESVAYPDDTRSRIAYAANGDVTNAVNAKGECIAYAYDKEGNKVSAKWPNGRTFAWTYDANGNCTRASDSVTGAVTMEYDNKEQLTRIVYPGNRGFTYAYDAYGRVTARTSLEGHAQKYVYDSFGRLAKMTDGSGKTYVANTYDPVTGNLVLQTYGNGTVVSNAYDLLDRTVSITHRKADGTVLESFAYAYNEDGQRISLTTKEGVERYTYDAAGQVIGVVYPDGTEENFTYDAVGNRLATADETYTVNALNQYTAVGSARRTDRDATFTYDLDGNLLSRTSTADGTTTYAYDCESRLIAVTNSTKNIAWSCEYDVFGNRVRITDNGVTTEKLYVQGSLPSVAAEYVNGTLSVRHVLSGAVRIADINGEAVSSPLEQESIIHYYHADGLASTRLLTDASGAVVATADYKAFGDIRHSSGVSITDGYVGTLGVERDATGLLFMRNRYYDPATGRFVQRDPIGLRAGDVNWYRYCWNAVTCQVDCNGLDSSLVCGSAMISNPDPNFHVYDTSNHKSGWSLTLNAGFIAGISVGIGQDEYGHFGLSLGVGPTLGATVTLSGPMTDGLTFSGGGAILAGTGGSVSITSVDSISGGNVYVSGDKTLDLVFGIGLYGGVSVTSVVP